MAKRPMGMKMGAAATPPAPLMNELMALYKAGRFADVVAKGKPVLRQFPKSFALWNLIGAASAQSGQLRTAAEAFEKAAQLNKTSPDPFNNLGNVYKELGQTRDAERAYKKALAVNPAYPNAYNNLAVIRTAEGDLDEAEKLLTKALHHAPKYAEAHCNLGNVHRARNAQELAIAAYKRALALNPSYAEALGNLGVVFHETGDLEQAMGALMQALRVRPNVPDVLRNLGAVMRDKGDLEQAIAATKRALELKPDDPKALGNLGLMLFEKGDLDGAGAAYDRALKIRPVDIDNLNGFGVVCKAAGRSDAAISAFRRAAEIDPQFLPAQINLGSALRSQGRTDEALTVFDGVLAKDPQNAECLTNKGGALTELGRMEEAAALYVAALDTDPAQFLPARNLAIQPVGTLTPDIVARLAAYQTAYGHNIAPDSARLFFDAYLKAHQGDVDGAFAGLCEANATKLAELRAEGEVDLTPLKEVRERLVQLESDPSAPAQGGIIPVFVLGPTRSGKSLLESQLCKSPLVKPLYEGRRDPFASGSEVSFDTLFYHKEADLLDAGYRVAVSTNPHSILRLTEIARAMPQAIFIFVQRDPQDVGPEMFATEYLTGNEYSYDPTAVVAYLQDYAAIAEAVRAKLPQRVLDFDYETILKAPTEVVAAIGQCLGQDLPTAEGTMTGGAPRQSIYRQQFAAYLAGTGGKPEVKTSSA